MFNLNFKVMTKGTLLRQKKEDLVDMLLMSENKRVASDEKSSMLAKECKALVKKVHTKDSIIKVLLFVEFITLLLLMV